MTYCDNIPLSDLSKISVQDEDMYLLNEEVIRQVLDGAKIEGTSVAGWGLEQLEPYLDNEVFDIAIVRYGSLPWMPYLISEVDGCPYRGVIQKSHCGECGWSGLAFAPIPDYFNDSLKIGKKKLSEALAKSSKKCPKCKAEIPKQPAFFRFER